MSKKQQIALIAPPILVVMMLGVFRLAALLVGCETAWYVVFGVYWLLWCVLFPGWLLGWQEIKKLFRHRSLDTIGWLFFFFPLAMTLIGRFVMTYDQATMWQRIVLIFMAFANGILEEILWRGTFITLFPGNARRGIAWLSMWFAFWHLAPGSVLVSFSPWVLMMGAAVFGFCWAWLAMKTGPIRWSMGSHILTGLVRVLG